MKSGEGASRGVGGGAWPPSSYACGDSIIYTFKMCVWALCAGTNDKAGAASFLQKWVSPMSIKETMTPYTEWSYPSVDK